MNSIIERLSSRWAEAGWQGRVVPIRHLQDLQGEIEGRHAQGQFPPEFYEEALSFFSYGPASDFPPSASLIVVAVPRPQSKVRFTLRDQTLTLNHPPTFAGFKEIPLQVGGRLIEWLAPEGFRVAPARLPQKLLAVRSGLAEYGRNNIAYIPGMGSFFQTVAYYSDLPCPEDPWREPRMMDRCKACRICQTRCPTGAIPADRFLLHAERCLVFHNERGPAHPFPAWIDPSAHNGVLGCMLCQQCCPENKPFLDWFEGHEAFSHEETSLLLQGASVGQLSAETRGKLERLDLLDYLESLPRNLGVLFRA
jgi:epoxyqueuosine reductase